MDWQALLHNKWALGGLGVAAAAGAFVLYKRSKAGGGGGGSAVDAANASPAYSGGVGGFDSTGTDVAGWLGSYSGNLQNELDQFAQQQSNFLTALTSMQQTQPATAGTSSVPPIVYRTPRTAAPTASTTTTTSALARLARR